MQDQQTIIRETTNLLYNHYTNDALNNGWARLLILYTSNHWNKVPDESKSAVDLKMVGSLKSYNTKKKMCQILGRAFWDDNFIQYVLEKLPSQHKVAWIWDKKWVSLSDLDQIADLSPLITRGRNTTLSSTFQIFTVIQVGGYRYHLEDKSLILPGFVADRFRSFVKKPAYYFWNHSQDIEGTNILKFSFERDILTSLPKLSYFIKNDMLKRGKKGDILLSSLKTFKKELKVPVFFMSDMPKSAQGAGAKMIIEIAEYLSIKSIDGMGAQDMLHTVINAVNSDIIKIWPIVNSYLKGSNKIDPDNSMPQTVFTSMLAHSCEKPGWVSSINMYYWMHYHNHHIIPYAEHDYLHDKMYVNAEMQYVWDNKVHITNENYRYLIKKPYYYGAIFLMAALGLVDIAYSKNNIYQKITNFQSEGQTLIPFGALTHFRVNDLGKFILGITDQYESDIKEFEPVTIMLDTSYLIIQLSKPDEAISTLLIDYAQNISHTTLIVTSQSFLKKVVTKSDFVEKKATFLKFANQDFPQNWQSFFDSLEERFHPLIIDKSPYQIYKIPEENNAILELLSQDKQLQSLLVKAEGRRILVQRAKVNSFVKLMKERGWII